ncbi:MAG TPA: P-type conjugative transfer protein TrbJ [Gemmataceae bacterium]|nr:P-type conjugative transfer protein TrbJ [Gemmataceae bacterium]
MSLVDRRNVRRFLLATVCIGIAAGPTPVHADLPVIDTSNLAQNILTAARTLQEINNQIVQIEQFVQMLENEARNLTSLPSSIISALDSAVSQITTLMNAATGILYNVTNVESQFSQFYPQTISPGSTDSQIVADAQTRWQYSLQSFQHTMELQSQIVQGMPADQAQLDAVLAQSQGAVGILQAAQAGNQLTALLAKQLLAAQTLLATQGRAQAIEQARRAEAEEEAHEQYQRFLGASPGGYSPIPVVMFH